MSWKDKQNNKPNTKKYMLELWVCPECNYAVISAIYYQARYDFRCPRCKKTTLSQFYQIKMEL